MACIATFAAGFGAAWYARDHFTHYEGKPRRAVAEWVLAPASVDAVCGKTGGRSLRRALQSAPPRPTHRRLSDHLLDSSPVAAYDQRGYNGPVTELSHFWEAAYVRHGATRGYARSFNSSVRPGGFTMYAYQFPTKHSAVSAVAAAYHQFVCRFGADPATVAGHPGILVGVGTSDDTIAWWVQEDQVVELDYSMYGDRERDLRNVLEILRAAYGPAQRPSNTLSA